MLEFRLRQEENSFQNRRTSRSERYGNCIMKEKKLHLEFVRIFAIFFVLYSHTGIEAKFHYQIAGELSSELISFVLLCISMTCNALFFMVTGAVLLHKEESLKEIYRRRILKTVVIILLFSLFQYTYYYLTMPEMGFDLPFFFKVVYSTQLISQYWFLYAYLALLIMLPFLRSLAREMTRVQFVYMLSLYFIMDGILPVIEYFWENSSINIYIPLLEGYVFLPLTGYYIEHKAKDDFADKRVVFALNIAAVAALVIDVLYARHRYYADGEIASTLNGMMLLMALAVFVDFRFLCAHVRLPIWLQKTVLFLGSGAFTVYLLNLQLTDLCYGLYEWLEPYVKWVPATIIWLSAAICVGSVLAFLWRILKRVVTSLLFKK